MANTAYEIRKFSIGTLVAGEDLTEKQFHGVRLNNNGEVVAATETHTCLGVLQDKPLPGEPCDIEVLGVSKVKYGAPVTAGQNLMLDQVSRFIPHEGDTPSIAIAFTNGDENNLGTALLINR